MMWLSSLIVGEVCVISFFPKLPSISSCNEMLNAIIICMKIN